VLQNLAILHTTTALQKDVGTTAKAKLQDSVIDDTGCFCRNSSGVCQSGIRDCADFTARTPSIVVMPSDPADIIE